MAKATLVSHRCATCGQRGSHEVIDQYGNSAGHFCKLCGARRVKELNGEVKRVDRG